MDNDTILSDKLDKWNSDLARGLTPNNVILSLYIIAGLLGNSTVILIYGFKMKGNKEERYFIPFLATADFLASLVCASFGIALNMMQAKFNNNNLCKAWWFFAALTTSCSFFLLMIIAVHRYLKICRPLGRQMTLKWKRFGMCLVLVIAFILSIPTNYFYGSVSFPNEEEGIVGLRCSRLNGNSQLPNPNSVEHLSEAETGFCSVETDNTELSGVAMSTIITEPNIRVGFVESKTTETKQNTFNSSAKRRKEQSNKKAVYKFTLMFMLITVIFLICYIPKVTLL